MYTLRRAADRGYANHGWLESRHSFSFADYHDPKHMGFGPLRVINDDRVAPGGGFGTHPHRDMEIISYVVSGALEHRDSMGNGSLIRPGELQRMTAGVGVTHSEYNHSRTEPVHFLQIWIRPEKLSLEPGYEQKDFGERRRNRWCLVASRDGREDSVVVHQDVQLFAALLDPAVKVDYPLPSGRKVWLQVVTGTLRIDGNRLESGDGLAVEEEKLLTIVAEADSNVLLFDLPA